MAFTEWKSTKKDGTLPLSSPATRMQYRRFVKWEIDLSGFGIGQRTGLGKWEMELRSGDATPFRQIVRNNVSCVSLGVPGLQFFTWQQTREKISTTWIANQITNVPPLNDIFVAPIGVINTASSSGLVEDEENRRLEAADIIRIGNPSWLKTLSGAGPTSEFGTAIPGGGADYSDKTAYIEFYWQSPIYNLELQPGVQLKVIMDAWGLGTSSRPEWQFRFEAASSMGVLLDRQHGLFHAKNKSNTTQFSVGYFLEHRYRRDNIDNITQPKMWKSPSNRLYTCAKESVSKQWLIWYCDLEGYEMLPLKYSFENAEPEKEGEHVAMWNSGYELDDVKEYQRGYATIARQGGMIYFRVSPDNIKVGPMQPVASHQNKACYLLIGTSADGEESFRVTDGDGVDFQSLDGGYEWTNLTALYQPSAP